MRRALFFALAASASAVAFVSFLISRRCTELPIDTPCIHVEPLVDLGIIDTGRTAEGRFEITNRGGGVLAISGVRSSCGCLGAWLVADGARMPFQRAELAHGEGITVELQFLVLGETGQPVRQSLEFATDQ